MMVFCVKLDSSKGGKVEGQILVLTKVSIIKTNFLDYKESIRKYHENLFLKDYRRLQDKCIIFENSG